MGLLKGFNESIEKQKAEDAQKSPAERKKDDIIAGIIGIVLLFSIGSCMFSGNSTSTHTNAQASAVSQSVKENPAPPVKRNEDILKDSIQKGISDFPSILCKFQSVEINAGANDANYVVINLNAKIGYDKTSTLSDFDNTAKYVFKAVYTANLPIKISNCKIIFNSKFANTKTGEETSEGIYAMGLDSAAASQIHWDKISNIDISQSVNDRYIHPSFRSMK